MKALITAIVAIMGITLMPSCNGNRNENVIHKTHAYDIIKVNDTTLLAVPTGLTLDGDTLKCQKFRL